MGLLDGFEKLINEHGSATILKERIALANDKYAALEAENEILRSENKTLRLDNVKLNNQRGALENQLSKVHNNVSVNDLVLKLISKSDAYTITKLSEEIGQSQSIIEHWVSHWQKHEYLKESEPFRLTEKGMFHINMHRVGH